MTVADPVAEAPEVEAENDEQPPASYGRSRGGRRGGQREGRESRDNRDGRDSRDGRDGRENRSEAGAPRGEGQPQPALSERDNAMAAAAAEAEARARARKARELRERQEQAAATSRRAAAPEPEENDVPAGLPPTPPTAVSEQTGVAPTDEGATPAATAEDTSTQASPRRRSRGGRSGAKARAQANEAQAELPDDTVGAPVEAAEPAATVVVASPEVNSIDAASVDTAAPAAKKARRPRAAAKKAS